MVDPSPAHTDSGAAAAAAKRAASRPAGSVSDALQPLADALTAAGKSAVLTESAGDPAVIAAVRLGWLLAELTHGWSLKPVPSGLPLTIAEQCQAQAGQLTGLLDVLELTGVQSVEELVAALRVGPDIRRAGVLDRSVRVSLAGADARLPVAYMLGRGLRLMIPGDAHGAGPPAPVGAPAETLIAALDSLSSALPAHAARSVGNSIGSWTRSADDSGKAGLAEAQVNLWRSVLVGEKRGTELLEPGDYLDAAEKLGARYASQALHNRWIRVIGVVALLLFVGGVVFLVEANGHAGDVAAGASGVLAAVGLTWKGIGGTLGGLVGKLKAPLWGAELDTAITEAITLVDRTPPKAGPPGSLSYGGRRARAVTAAQRRAADQA